LSFKKFADQKRRTVVRANVMDSQDVRMVQRRNRARFLFETPQPVGIIRQPSGSTLIATSRPSRVSRARYTSPMPPAPSEQRFHTARVWCPR
jgi:hypothetical protein